MLGKLTIHSIPYHDPIIMSTIAVVFIFSTLVIGTVTYYKKWTYLWNEWLTSVDHKKIGIMYVMVSCIMFLRGFADAIMMRTQQALSSLGLSEFLSVHHYDQVVTAHGVIMIIFMATPFVIGLMNIIVPLQIGARDVAFPFLNSLSFWLFMVGVILINLSLGIGEFAQTGWAAYPPLSSKEYSPDVGVDYWIWSIQISGIGTTLTGINFFTTILYMRAPGMSMMKIPVFTWTALCTNALIIVAFPILTVTIALLTFDRYLGTHFFTNDLGGNMMMYINLFWAWGHPEVYILALPAFGIFSEIVSTFSQKKIFGYTTLIWATIAITALSFCVWLHHFFTMGAGSNVNAFFGIMTMIIAIPTGVKVFNWLFTMYQGKIIFKTPMLWAIGFIITFSIGGMTGVLLAIPGIDFLLHNSLFLVAHFHNVIIGGVLFGCFAGMSYWFPKAFGYTLHENWGKCAFWLWIIGFYIAFMPLYILGFMGMTRRLSQNIDTIFSPMLITAAIGTFLIGLGILCQCIQIIISVFNRDKYNNYHDNSDPWNGSTLEWATSSPPPFYNFAHIPIINNNRNVFWYIENRKNVTLCKNKTYEPIHMPKNTHDGILIAFFSLLFGFSMIWYIWWLSILSLFGIIGIWIAHTFNNNTEYYVPSNIIKEIEHAHNKHNSSV
ncbi:cytochrome o ubiquinol oxidase, subunit I [Candidatus Blochmanniella vafra str. BVAF]|uniref:Cytochrome bo(3) ubiquinol oxidase subunit 1 n=1 Tax=Blochmanniella vafra (strain BVAF) TaxID=859654 RepID=E8Q627_BLOVB|nr:cytochrome o ubiquinol oxidase subunit I [Candidatus Blochmannia vafer]ADV33643.1 cytochrome o ubiquinol oxidase, subunit I [Candidatus Blochmannia vafer str. BVAF]